MRKTIIAGLVLALASALVMWLSAVFDLELESVVLLGAAVGAVVALVPDRTPLVRFLGFAAGFVAAWLGFFARAAFLPDTAGGRAVAVALVLLLCVVVVAVSAGRLPLWSALLGAAAMVGGYEYTYAAAPPEVATTSVSAATSLLFCIAVGYLVAATRGAAGSVRPRRPAPAAHERRGPREHQLRRPDGEDQVNPRITLLRVAATSGVAAVLCGMVAAPAVAADGDVDVVNTETVQVYTSPTGEVETQRVYEQLILTGTGSVDLSNPISTDGLRNLDGFGGFDVKDGEQVTEMTVDGEEHLRSVSDFDGDLPLDVSVAYKLDGETVEPGDIVGESGELEVLYTVKNITAQPQEVSFPDGSGGTTTETVDVPIPMVGSLTTVAPETFTNVHSDQANMAGDGKGGTKLSFTMTLFPPIGSDTAEFGYTADIVDGVVPRSDVSALPVNPLESPTFAAAADSYQGGTETGARLAEGAATIDSNLLKLRDGAVRAARRPDQAPRRLRAAADRPRRRGGAGRGEARGRRGSAGRRPRPDRRRRQPAVRRHGSGRGRRQPPR